MSIKKKSTKKQAPKPPTPKSRPEPQSLPGMEDREIAKQ